MWPRQRVRKARVAVISRFFLQSIPKNDNFGPIAPILTFHTILESTRQVKQLLLHVRRSSEGLNHVKFAFKDKNLSKIRQKSVKIGAIGVLWIKTRREMTLNSIWLICIEFCPSYCILVNFCFCCRFLVDMNPFRSIYIQFNLISQDFRGWRFLLYFHVVFLVDFRYISSILVDSGQLWCKSIFFIISGHRWNLLDQNRFQNREYPGRWYTSSRSPWNCSRSHVKYREDEISAGMTKHPTFPFHEDTAEGTDANVLEDEEFVLRNFNSTFNFNTI